MKIPLFSRSGVSDPHGKCTAELKTAIPEQSKEEFTAVAFMNGKGSAAEYLRSVVNAHLYGAVQPDMQALVWEHVCRETESDYLRKLMRVVIFGAVHESSVIRSEQAQKGEKTAVML